jgi:hypothetical protein
MADGVIDGGWRMADGGEKTPLIGFAIRRPPSAIGSAICHLPSAI